MPSVSHHVSDDVNAGANSYRRIEVITGIKRRREWNDDEKLAIIAESFATTTSISDVARRHGLNRNQLFRWRRQFREGQFGLPEGVPMSFVPVVSGAGEGLGDIPLPAAPHSLAVPPVVIEVAIGAMMVRVPPMAEEAALRRVLSVVRDFA